MRLYLASPHTLLKFRDGGSLALQVFGGVDMKVFMAGNTIFPKYIAPELYGGDNMTIYLAGGYSGNIKPAWKLAARTDVSADGFIKGLYDASFWQGSPRGGARGGTTR